MSTAGKGSNAKKFIQKGLKFAFEITCHKSV